MITARGMGASKLRGIPPGGHRGDFTYICNGNTEEQT
jgi:hypothetical protein